MSILSLFQKRAVPLLSIGSNDPQLIKLLGGYGPTAAGVSISEQSALHVSAFWSATELYGSTVAALPLKVWRDSPSGMRTAVDVQLFKDPMNADLDLTWFEGIELLVRSALIYGNAYAFKVRNELGDKVVSLVPFRPSDVHPFTQRTDRGVVKLFRVHGVADPMTPADVMHIPGPSFDGVSGLARVQAAREALGTAIAAETAGGRLFDSGLLNGGVLQTDQELDEDQATLTKQRWMDKIAGVAKAYEVAVLDRGLKFTPATIPPKDAQWIEARQFAVAEVARFTRVPPALLWEYTATGNVEADKLGAQWLRFGLNQWLVRFEKRFSMHLLPRGQFCEFERAGLLQGTPREQAEVEKMQIDSGVLTVDEARALHNRRPAPKPAPLAVPPPAAGPPTDEQDGEDGD